MVTVDFVPQVLINVEANEKNRLVLVTVFKNTGGGSYFLDNKLAFKGGEYTLSCLSIFKGQDKIERKINFKLKASRYPDDYIEILPKSYYKQTLELKEHFHIPKEGILELQYKCKNKNHQTGGRDELLSNKLIINL